MTEIIGKALDLLIVIVPLLPLIFRVTKLYGQKGKHQNLVNLSTRAEIIVNALFQQDTSSEEKRKEGIRKIVEYANEVGIKITKEQAEDYIENAYRSLKEMNEENEKL